jgi:hypothetical protein
LIDRTAFTHLYSFTQFTNMVRAKITKSSEGSEKDVEIANGVEVDPFEALKLQEQDHDVSDLKSQRFSAGAD